MAEARLGVSPGGNTEDNAGVRAEEKADCMLEAREELRPEGRAVCRLVLRVDAGRAMLADAVGDMNTRNLGSSSTAL